jgi:hypothetical protein
MTSAKKCLPAVTKKAEPWLVARADAQPPYRQARWRHVTSAPPPSPQARPAEPCAPWGCSPPYTGAAHALLAPALSSSASLHQPAAQQQCPHSTYTLRKPAVSWVVGAFQAEESDFVYSVTYTGLAVPRVGARS